MGYSRFEIGPSVPDGITCRETVGQLLPQLARFFNSPKSFQLVHKQARLAGSWRERFSIGKPTMRRRCFSRRICGSRLPFFVAARGGRTIKKDAVQEREGTLAYLDQLSQYLPRGCRPPNQSNRARPRPRLALGVARKNQFWTSLGINRNQLTNSIDFSSVEACSSFVKSHQFVHFLFD